MRTVIIVIESLHLGGSEKSLVSLLENIDSRKYTIEILLFKPGGEFEKFISDSIKINKIEFNPSLWERLKFKLLKVVNAKGKFHNAQLFWKSFKNKFPNTQRNYDIAIAWAQGFATYYVAERIKAKKKYAWINTDIIKAGYDTKFNRTFYEKFSGLVGVSKHVHDELKRLFPEIRVHLIRDIVDLKEIESWSREPLEFEFDPKALNIVSVGRLAVAKNYGMALNAITIIKGEVPNVKLFIIGEGPERIHLEALITENNLENQVTLLGYKENPYPFIKACDIYLQTSSFEGLGRTIIEAAALNKPIVTTNFPTAYQILDDKETGLIVEMNPKAIANGILKLFHDKEFSRKLIHNLKGRTENEINNSLNSIYRLLD